MFQLPDFPQFCFSEEVILNLLMLLNLTKHMGTVINQSDDQVTQSVFKSLVIILKNFIDTGTSPDILKRMIP